MPQRVSSLPGEFLPTIVLRLELYTLIRAAFDQGLAADATTGQSPESAVLFVE